ncbi:hypothetical protein CR513_11841, partial [Mucuna pruriens]
MSNLASKLKSLKLEFDEDLLIIRKRKNIKDVVEESSKGKKPKKNEEFTCFFCKKSGHMKKQCPNYAAWCVKKDIVPKQDYDKVLPQTPIKQPQQPQEMSLRRSIKDRRHAILDDYIVFLQEHEDGIGLIEDDPINFCQAMQSSNSQKWIDAMKDEMKSMQDNDDNSERYKTRLVVKGFTQKEDIDCVYHKFSGSKYIFLVLYVDDILLTSSDTSLLHEIKRFLTKNFEMKDLGKASLVLGIQIVRDHSQGILRLSQESYINKVLDRFGIKDSKPEDTPIAKGDKFSFKQCPNNDLERNEM